MREIAGPVLPGDPYGLLSVASAQLRAFAILTASGREGLDGNEKFFIQSDFRLAGVAGLGLGVATRAGCSSCIGWAQRRTCRYWS